MPTLKVLCAPDSFKGSLSATQAADAMRRGLMRFMPDLEVDHCPVADGGEGTVDALIAATSGRAVITRIPGPRVDSAEQVEARWGLLDSSGDVAVIEMAAASGLTLLPVTLRDPAVTTTLGTGRLVAAAMDAGVRRILLGIGGSATCDGGCGAAQALGTLFFDRRDQRITQPITGGMLRDIARIDAEPLRRRMEGVTITIAADVRNPLLGPEGAAAVYGPQKGASPRQVWLLNEGLAHVAELWRRDLNRDVAEIPGAGAAGGLGGGAMAMFNATLRPGIELVLEIVGFDNRLRGAALVLTGEGRLDGQTLAGKTVAGVAAAARRQGVPVIALTGALGEGIERLRDVGVSQWRAIGQGLSAQQSMARAAELLEEAAADVGRELRDGGEAWLQAQR